MASFDTFDDERFFEVKRFVSEYSFRLREIEWVEVRVRIWETKDNYGGCHYSFDQSHYLRTPIQADPYMTSTPFGETEVEALHRALRTFEGFISGAKAGGHKPASSWLVKNEEY
jgi:hypothetical protein